MKKFCAFLIAVCCALCACAETVFTFTSAEDIIQEKDGIIVMLDQADGSNAPYYDAYQKTGPEVRVYGKNTITVDGAGLKNIQIVFALPDGKKYATLTAAPGQLTSGGTSTGRDNPVVDTWTGDASTVVFTFGEGGQRIIRKLVVNGAPLDPDDEQPKEPDPLPTADDLQTGYTYAEPTVVHVKDTTIAKSEYAFIDNNILVYCEQGSILPESTAKGDEHPAYFNCNATYRISFTATENIKGIAIDGFVRKAFNATCDHGSITYLTDPDKDEEGAPALVIQDINAKSVTLTCPKQIRCYQLRVYFKENPDAIDMGEGMESVQHTTYSVQKVLRNGQLLILRGENTYNATGIIVR